VLDDAKDEDDQHGIGSSKYSDNASVSIDTNSFVLINETWAGSPHKTESVSVVSISLSSNSETSVPFQELIMLALRYIEQVPPRVLMKLASRRYTSEQLCEILQLLDKHNQITLPSAAYIAKDPEGTIAMCLVLSCMFDLPSWACTPKCYLDNILKEVLNTNVA
jgi:hypothetical protein